MNEKISVLVNSCDKYEDAWKPFFHFFKKHWSACPYKVYLNTESKQYVDDDIEIHTINSRKGISWSKRLKNALKQIDTEYIIFLLEDFFFLDDVDQGEIDKCLGYMEEDKKITTISFVNYVKPKLLPSNIPGYGEKDENGRYFLGCQAALWRRKDLIKYLSPYENAWQYEEVGTERAKLYGKKFLKTYESHAFVYELIPESGGFGICNGKWLESNVDLFKKEGLSVNFDRLGMWDGKRNTSYFSPVKISFKWKMMYLLYGGYTEKKRMPISTQFKWMFIHPKRFIKACYRKVRFLFKRQTGVL